MKDVREEVVVREDGQAWKDESFSLFLRVSAEFCVQRVSPRGLDLPVAFQPARTNRGLRSG